MSEKKFQLRAMVFCCFSFFSSAIVSAEQNGDLNGEQNGEPTWFNSLTTNAVKISAYITIYTAEIVASDAAEKELKKFRTGEHNGNPALYLETSDETHELFEGDYYQQLSQYLMSELAAWYGGEIPIDNGLFYQSNTFRVFNVGDLFHELTDGIDLADVIGSMTYYVRASTKNGVVYFEGVNKMSLESYSGQNYLKHGLVSNPKNGAFRTTTQVFKWQIVIPTEFRK